MVGRTAVGSEPTVSDDVRLAESLELLRRIHAGDRAQVDRLLERYQARLLGRIRLMMGRPARRVAESADFLQGALIEAARDIDQARVANEAQLLRWMTEIARNNIRDAVRRRREHAFAEFSETLAGSTTPDETLPSPASLAARRDEQHRLAEALERLPEDLHTVIELRHFEQMPFRHIGKRMGRSENAAQLLHSRALVRLGELL